MTLVAEKPGWGSVARSLCSEMKANYLFREKILGKALKTGSSQITARKIKPFTVLQLREYWKLAPQGEEVSLQHTGTAWRGDCVMHQVRSKHCWKIKFLDPAHCTKTFAGTRKGQSGGDNVSSNECQFKEVAGVAAVNQLQQAELSSRASLKVYWAFCSPPLPKLFQVSTSIDLLGFNRQGYK